MKNFLMDESGATAIEYGLIAAAIGLMLVAVLPSLSGILFTKFNAITTGLGGTAATTNGGVTTATP